MKEYRTNFSRRLATSLVAVLASGTLLGSPAQAVTDTVFKYSEPKNGYLMLGPADFVPESRAIAYSIGDNDQMETTSSSSVCFYAPVHLPQAAVFKQLRVYYARPTAADRIQVTLRRFASGLSGFNTLANYPPAQAPVKENGSITYAAQFPETNVINNGQYRYDVEVCLANAANFFNARIDYTYTNAGD